MAITTPNLGLRVWNLTVDPYDHAQLADNWAKVDEHDHSSGKGKQIPTGGIADGAITSAKVADGVLPTLDIDDGSIVTAKLADGAVTLVKLGANSVNSSKIVDGSIQTADIGNSQVTTPKLATDSVDNTILKDDASVDGNRAVTTDHIRNMAVTADKLSDNVASYSGITTATGTRRAKVEIPTDQTTVSSSYVYLASADKINSVVVPTDGILFILYRALWKLNGASNDGKAAIFLTTQQLSQTEDDQPALTALAATLVSGGDNYGPLFSVNGNLDAGGSQTTDTGTDISAPTTWGKSNGTLWAPLAIEIQAGTYDVGVKFKTNSSGGGTLHVKQRKLWVWTQGF